MYSIKFTSTALKDLSKLDKNIQERIYNVLERCKIRPESHAKKLVGNKYFSLRVGSYRVIIDIDNGELIVMVIEIGHRRNIYKKK